MDAQAQRRLLDLAAKAAGVEIEWNIMINPYSPILAPKTQQERNWLGHEHTPWNPLDDDGDALRLAVSLRLTTSWDRFNDDDYATATPPHTHQGYDCIVDQDSCKATRLAIVRAAAAIGEKMEAKP